MTKTCHHPKTVISVTIGIAHSNRGSQCFLPQISHIVVTNLPSLVFSEQTLFEVRSMASLCYPNESLIQTLIKVCAIILWVPLHHRVDGEVDSQGDASTLLALGC